MTEHEIYEKQLKNLSLEYLRSLMSQVKLTDACGRRAANIVYQYYMTHLCPSGADKIITELLLADMSKNRDKRLDHTTKLAERFAERIADMAAKDRMAGDSRRYVDCTPDRPATREPTNTKKGRNARWNALIAAVQTSFERYAGKMMPDLGDRHYFLMDICIRDAMNSKLVAEIKETYYKEK